MSRQPHDIANVNLRIRETLRAKLERAAEEHRMSLNNEIRLRLEDSLETDARRGFDDIRRDMEICWARFAARFTRMELGDQLADAVVRGEAEKAKTLARLIIEHRAVEQRQIEGA
jgi:hypothetical protein